jgi:uncharacterized delta-60 repeat protein
VKTSITRTLGCSLVGITLLLQVASVFSHEGDFDPAFGDGGRLVVDVGAQTNDNVNALVVRPDGKMLMAGSCVYVTPLGHAGYTFCMTKLRADGSYDDSFGPSGTGYLEFEHFSGWPTTDASLADMIVLGDGRIALLGNTVGQSPTTFLLAVLLADGSALDASVGGTGYMQLQFGGYPSTAARLVQQPDGKILVAGAANGFSGNSDFAVSRLLADFSGFDLQFGSAGSQLVAFDLGGPTGDNTDACNAVTVQSNGKIVLTGGSITTPANSPPSAAVISLARLTAGGVLDPSFGPDGNGRVHYSAGQAVAFAQDGQADAGDHIVVAGIGAASAGATTGSWIIDRLTPDGASDPTFNQGNPQVFYQPPGNGGSPTRLALTSDGIFAIGTTPRAIAGTTNYFAVARLNWNGSLDARFGNGGRAYGSFTATRDVDTSAIGIAVGNGGLIVAGTQTQSITGDSANTHKFAIGRLQYDQIFSFGFE